MLLQIQEAQSQRNNYKKKAESLSKDLEKYMKAVKDRDVQKVDAQKAKEKDEEIKLLKEELTRKTVSLENAIEALSHSHELITPSSQNANVLAIHRLRQEVCTCCVDCIKNIAPSRVIHYCVCVQGQSAGV